MYYTLRSGYLAIFVSTSLISGCFVQKECDRRVHSGLTLLEAEKDFRIANFYVPIQPINFSDYYINFDLFRKSSGREINKRLYSLGRKDVSESGKYYDAKVSKEKVMELFPNESSRVYVEEFTLDGKLALGPSTLSKTDRTYHITVDYLKYRTDSIGDVVYVSGFGLRMRVQIVSAAEGIDLTNIYALGAAASQKQVKGALEFDSIGISGRQITPLIPVPQSLSLESISSAMQALASIKAKMYADYDDVKIWPQITGVIGGEVQNSLKQLLTREPDA